MCTGDIVCVGTYLTPSFSEKLAALTSALTCSALCGRYTKLETSWGTYWCIQQLMSQPFPSGVSGVQHIIPQCQILTPCKPSYQHLMCPMASLFTKVNLTKCLYLTSNENGLGVLIVYLINSSDL